MKKKIAGKTPNSAASPQKSSVLPKAIGDALGYFSREEAKITTANVVKGGLVVVALGMLSYPEAIRAAHESLHMNFNTHANRGAQSSHINVSGIDQHSNANVHTNLGATGAHSNVGTHSSASAINAHNSANVHTSAAAVNTHASKPAINVAALHTSSGVTKGNFHNNGAQGKHSAWTAHASSATSAHANTAASSTHNNVGASSTHSSVDTHANTNAIDVHRNHNNGISSNAYARHAQIQTHANTGLTNVHGNIGAVNYHSNSNSHGSHGSHSSW